MTRFHFKYKKNLIHNIKFLEENMDWFSKKNVVIKTKSRIKFWKT